MEKNNFILKFYSIRGPTRMNTKNRKKNTKKQNLVISEWCSQEGVLNKGHGTWWAFWVWARNAWGGLVSLEIALNIFIWVKQSSVSSHASSLLSALCSLLSWLSLLSIWSWEVMASWFKETAEVCTQAPVGEMGSFIIIISYYHQEVTTHWRDSQSNWLNSISFWRASRR